MLRSIPAQRALCPVSEVSVVYKNGFLPSSTVHSNRLFDKSLLQHNSSKEFSYLVLFVVVAVVVVFKIIFGS